MFERIAVTSNNDKSIGTNTYIHHVPKGNPVCRIWMCTHRISFNLHDIYFEKKNRATERKLVQGQIRNGS